MVLLINDMLFFLFEYDSVCANLIYRADRSFSPHRKVGCFSSAVVSNVSAVL